jgi:hypothetical protein
VAVAAHPGLGLDQRAEGVQRHLGLGLLDEADDGVHHDHTEDDAGIDHVPEDEGNGTGDQQHVHERVVHLASKADERPGHSRGRELVWPEPGEAFTGLMGGQPAIPVGLEQQDNLVRD